MATSIAAREWIPHRRSSVAITDPFVPSYWDRRQRNPELAKALSLIQGYVGEARNLLDLDDAEAQLRTADVRERLRDLLTRDVSKLSIDSAWELANQLKRELLFLGDVSYVWTQLEYEALRDKKPDKWHRWSDHLPTKKLNTLLDARTRGSIDKETQLEAVRSLRVLYGLRAEAGLERRTRAAQKCHYLTMLIPILLVLQVALGAAIYEVGGSDMWKQIALAGSAGALGAALSGIFRVRDRLVELDDLRSFWPAMRIQPLIGATAGLVTLLVLESGAVQLGGGAAQRTPWAAVALFTFVAGFSEPFFLGLVRRVAVIPDNDATVSTPAQAS
jgi:hypothetical protein